MNQTIEYTIDRQYYNLGRQKCSLPGLVGQEESMVPVLTHTQRQEDLKALLSDEAGQLVENFIGRWNLSAYDQSFRQTDTASILNEITQDAKNILSEKSIPVDDELLLNIFNIVVLNYAGSAHDQPEMRKSMGI